MKKALIAVPVVLVGLVAGVPFLASLADVTISHTDMYHWVVPKTKKKAEPRPEVDAPILVFDIKNCDASLDNKYPDTPMNGTLYQGDKAVEGLIFKSGQARVKGERIELKLFSSEARTSCKDTDKNGAAPQDFTLIASISKADVETKKEAAAFKMFSTEFVKTLDYYYVAPGAATATPTTASAPASSSAPATPVNPMAKQLLAGLMSNVSFEAKAGSKVKGKAIFCFAQPSPEAKPIPKPADYEEGDLLPPTGLRHAVAGNFEIEFCPE